MRYPDPTTGSASTGQQETYTSDALSDTLTKTDRNGSVHTYTYDLLGRQTKDAITTLGSGVDGAVRRIETAYDTQGQPYLFTSYDTASGGSVVNQVQRVYNGLGQIITEYQATGGSVNTSTTPKVQYGYDTVANGSRLTSMTYSNGRVLTYNYSSGTDSNIGRLSSISDGSTTLESYNYLGTGTVVARNHPEPGLNLTYVGSGTGDAGDQYTGIDRFGRITDQKWVNSSSTVLDENTYTYDRNSNVLTKGNALNSALGEAYTYDNLNRLIATTRNGSAYQSWSLDPLGNMNSVTTSGTSVSRTNNSQNQLTALGSSTLAYDQNGNTTTDEQGRTLVYDAWNRLVEAKNGSTSLVRYAFDALGRRNKEASASIYFDAAWQEIEDRNSGGSTTASYAWSPVFVNAMIARDRDTDANGSLDERLYPTQDANWNVTGIVNVSGVVLQRAAFDSYGKRLVFTSTWMTTTDAYDIRQGFQGGFADTVLTNLILFQRRVYNNDTMRWDQEDPLGTNYQSGLSIYQFTKDSPLNFNDSNGLDEEPSGNWGTPEFLAHYRFGKGRGVDLEKIGLLDLWLNDSFAKQGLDIARARIKIDVGKASKLLKCGQEANVSAAPLVQSTKTRSGYFGDDQGLIGKFTNKNGALRDRLYSIGGSLVTINYSFSVKLTCKCDGKAARFNTLTPWKR